MIDFSIVINLDTRKGQEGSTYICGPQGDGIKSYDFITDGITNKIKMFDGKSIEVIVYFDIHEPLPENILDLLHNWQKEKVIDTLVFVNHTDEYYGESFCYYNDINYLNAMVLARGKYLVHFDSDVSCFVKDSSCIDEWVKLIEDGVYDFVSYPSFYSPKPDKDPRWDYYWASTRFFICKRSFFDYSEVMKCLLNPDYMYQKYGVKNKRCPWVEHILGIIAGNGRVFYPRLDKERYLIFSWYTYRKGLLKELNGMPFKEVVMYLNKWIYQYPCDMKEFRENKSNKQILSFN